MDPLTAIAASGLRARMESLELLANNVANASTGGYKADREFYSLYTAPEADLDSTNARDRAPLDRSFPRRCIHAPATRSTWRSPGGLLRGERTERSFIYAQRQLPPRADGKLVTSDGYAVRGRRARRSTLQSGRHDRYFGRRHDSPGRRRRRQARNRRFHQHRGLVKHGSNYFRVDRPGAVARGAVRRPPWSRASSKRPTPAAPKSAVRLVSVMRQFEMLQKAVTLGAEMNRAGDRRGRPSRELRRRIMIRALYSAASGMTAQQMNVDNIAHNLANANTTGFKTRRAQFQDLLYQTWCSPAPPPASRPWCRPACSSAWARARRRTRSSSRRATSRRPTTRWTW